MHRPIWFNIDSILVRLPRILMLTGAVALLTVVIAPLVVPLRAQVLPGIDVLVEDDFAPVAGRRVGLVINQTAVRRDPGSTTLDAFLATDRCRLVALFAPEHGIDGNVPAGARVANRVAHGSDNLPVYSLYGATRRPTAAMLKGVDVMVYDIQDIGVRSYTYISTLIRVMEGCADAGVPLVVLDRPNPIGGDVVDGPVLDRRFTSFVGLLPIPYIHGMTSGEIATMANTEGWLEEGRRCDLTVVRMKGWNRSMRWGRTGLVWIPTSPNIPSPEAAFTNGITGAAGELSVFNIGIGTPLAFQVIGREWIDAHKLAEKMNALRLPGLAFRAASWAPSCSPAGSHLVNGVQILRTGETTYPFSAQIALLTTIRDTWPERRPFAGVATDRWTMFDKVCGTDMVRRALLRGDGYEKIVDAWAAGLAEFVEKREGYLLYE